MSETEERQQVIKEALSWLKTPYHDEARVKGAGVDCGMLILQVFENCGLLEHVDVPHYAPDFYLHRSEEQYLGWVERYCKKVQRDPLPGDIILCKYGRCISHGGIVVEWPQIIHAYKRARAVILDDATKGELAERMTAIYSFWGDDQ